MTPVGFEPTISAGKRPQTYALDRAATGIGNWRDFPHEKTTQSAHQVLSSVTQTAQNNSKQYFSPAGIV